MKLKDFLTSVEDDSLPAAVKEHYQHNGIFLGSKVFKLSEQQKPTFRSGYSIKIQVLLYLRKN